LESVVELCLVKQLGVLSLGALNLDGDDLVGVDVRGEVDLAEGAAADLPSEPKLAADDAVHAARGEIAPGRGIGSLVGWMPLLCNCDVGG